MSGYATPADETTPRTVYCDAPSDPASMLQITGVTLLRNDESGIEVAMTFDHRLQSVLHQVEAQAGNAQYMNVYSPTPQVAFIYDRSANFGEELSAVVHFGIGPGVTIINRGVANKQSLPYKIRGDQLIFSIAPDMMAGLPANKRPEIQASFTEELWGPIPTTGGLNELIFKSKQKCSEGTQANSGNPATTASPSGSAPHARSGANTTQQSRVDQLDALLKSHGLSPDITISYQNGPGQGTKFMDSEGIPAALCGRMTGGASFYEILDAFGNFNAFSMTQSQAEQWLTDMITVYCPENL